MTAARISPAASLLRNSKLFALPAGIALPVPEPSSEPVPRSDTATTIYPTRAAIETPYNSLGRGDWGFKRPLPLKSTTKSGTPTVRLNRGIDTAEHIADFDSAADHVLTLKKFQELNQSIQHPRLHDNRSKVHLGVFRKEFDHTTNVRKAAAGNAQYSGVWPSLSPSGIRQQLPEALRSADQAAETNVQSAPQAGPALSTNTKVKRWHYDGPSLVQMSGLEFDQWTQKLDSQKRREFREAIKNDLLSRKRNDHVARAQDEGTVGEVDPATLQVSEEEVSEHLRRLRQQPGEFGRLIAEFLDLPEGPPGHRIRVKAQEVWEYGRETVASENYKESGPPRTHPSAGLSYIHSNRWAQNHAVFGPQDQRLPVVARQVKIRARGPNNVSTLGLAGFIVEKDQYKGIRATRTDAYEPQPGGQKTVVRPDRAEINEDGALKFNVKHVTGYQVEDELAVHDTMVSDARVEALRLARTSGSRVMPTLTRPAHSVEYKKREDIAPKQDEEEDLDFLKRS